MATENKTTRTKAGVGAFVTKIADPKRRGECQALVKLMEAGSGEKAAMWGTSIVGFGTYHYRGRSGREGDWFITGFSPRVQALTIYVMPGVESFPALMHKLGKYTTGKSCIYVRKLEDIDLPTLKKLVQASFKELKRLSFQIDAG